MELSKDTRPASAAFTATLETRIVSSAGDMCAVFQPGETRFIPRALFDAALMNGLIPVAPLEPAPVVVKSQTKEEVVEVGLVGACKVLIARGNPEDFTVVGQPRAASVKKLVDFSFTTKEVERAFSEAMHEVEQDGDDSTEHTEPSSVTAE
jgi:hypothetical protein